MNFLRHVFFGLLQIIELPVNLILDLWRLPGRGRGLLFGFPAIFVLILTLLAIGWAKYGSNQDLIDEYWRAHSRDRAKLETLNALISDKSAESQLGNPDEKTGADPANPQADSTNPLTWRDEMEHAIEREIRLPDLADDTANPRVRVRVDLDQKREVAKVEVVSSSGEPAWDKAVTQAIERTEAFSGVHTNEATGSSVELEFNLLESRREKLMYTMSIGLKKLIDLHPDNPEYKYELGILAAEMGDLGQARMLMDQVAPADKPGLCKGHVWQAKYIWESRVTNEPVSSRKSRCMNHLRLALASDPNDLAANEGLGELYFSDGNLVEAEKYFLVAWQKQLSPTLRLAAIYEKQGNDVKLNEILSHAKIRLEEVLEKDPQNTRNILDIQRILLKQGKVQEAIEFVEAYINDDNREILERQLARIFAGWAVDEATAQRRQFNRDDLLKVKRALEYDPTLVQALSIVTVIGTLDEPFAAEARAIYDPVAHRDDAPAIVLREYSTHLIRQGKYAEAIEWLETAYARFEDDPVTANNLAYLLLSSTPPDPERSLQLVTKAIERSQQFADPELRSNLYDTKAAAFRALNRPVDAIPYLEATLQYRTNNKTTMESLRDCYQAIGRKEMADFYQQKIDALPTTNPPGQ